MTRRPLEDIKILDLSWVIAGPHGTKMLCDLGAQIIKVESKMSLDVLRTGCQRKGNEDPRKEGGWAFNCFNTGKMDIAINLKSEKGREAFNKLVAQSDAVIANYGIKAFHKLKLTYDDLKEIKKDIIVLNASGLGDWGPYSNFVSFAPIIQSLTGITACTGYEGSEEPCDRYPPMADYTGSLCVANAVMAALEYRRKTGEGQFIDLSQFEGTAMYWGPSILDYQVNGTVTQLIGNHHYANDMAPHNVYKCKGDDKDWCAIAIGSESEWKKFCDVVDPSSVWTADKKFSTLEERLKNQKELDERVESWTRKFGKFEVCKMLQANGISAGAVETANEVVKHDLNMRERRSFTKVTYPESNKTPDSFMVTSFPFKMKGVEFPSEVESAPAVGEDTDYVLSEILGYSDEWIAQAKAEGSFE